MSKLSDFPPGVSGNEDYFNPDDYDPIDEPQPEPNPEPDAGELCGNCNHAFSLHYYLDDALDIYECRTPGGCPCRHYVRYLED